MRHPSHDVLRFVALFCLLAFAIQPVIPSQAATLPGSAGPAGVGPRQQDTVRLWTDDFSTDQPWIDASDDAIYRNPTKEWLMWQVRQDSTRRYYAEVGAAADEVRLSFRIKTTGSSANGSVFFGLAESLDGAWGLPDFPTGFFVATSHANSGLDIAHPRITYADREAVSLGDSGADWAQADPAGYLNLETMNQWRRIELAIRADQWTLAAYDDVGFQLGFITGQMPATHAAYRYLILFLDDSGGEEWQNGLLDDVELVGLPGTASAADVADEAVAATVIEGVEASVVAQVDAPVDITLNTGASLYIPPGSFETGQTVEFRAVQPPAEVTTSSADTAIGQVYEITADNWQPNMSAVITLPIGFDDVTEENADQIRLGYYDGSTWVAVPSSVDLASRTVTGTVSHFTLFSPLRFLTNKPPTFNMTLSQQRYGGATQGASGWQFEDLMVRVYASDPNGDEIKVYLSYGVNTNRDDLVSMLFATQNFLAHYIMGATALLGFVDDGTGVIASPAGLGYSVGKALRPPRTRSNFQSPWLELAPFGPGIYASGIKVGQIFNDVSAGGGFLESIVVSVRVEDQSGKSTEDSQTVAFYTGEVLKPATLRTPGPSALTVCPPQPMFGWQLSNGTETYRFRLVHGTDVWGSRSAVADWWCTAGTDDEDCEWLDGPDEIPTSFYTTNWPMPEELDDGTYSWGLIVDPYTEYSLRGLMNEDRRVPSDTFQFTVDRKRAGDECQQIEQFTEVWADLEVEGQRVRRSEISGEGRYDDLTWVVAQNNTVLLRRQDATLLTLFPEDLIGHLLDIGPYSVWLEADYGGETHKISNTAHLSLEPPQIALTVDGTRVVRGDLPEGGFFGAGGGGKVWWIVRDGDEMIHSEDATRLVAFEPFEALDAGPGDGPYDVLLMVVTESGEYPASETVTVEQETPLFTLSVQGATASWSGADAAAFYDGMFLIIGRNGTSYYEIDAIGLASAPLNEVIELPGVATPHGSYPPQAGTYDVWLEGHSATTEWIPASNTASFTYEGMPLVEEVEEQEEEAEDAAPATSNQTVSTSGSGDAVSASSQPINVRAEPGQGAPVVTTLQPGIPVRVLSRLPDGSWVRIQMEQRVVGWVFASLLNFNIDLNSVSVEYADVVGSPSVPPAGQAQVPPSSQTGPSGMVTNLPGGAPSGGISGLPSGGSDPLDSQAPPLPPMSISFVADRTSITYGSCATLRWDVEGIQAVLFQGVGVAGHDTRRVCPHSTTTYTLSVLTVDNDTVIRTITITVRSGGY